MLPQDRVQWVMQNMYMHGMPTSSVKRKLAAVAEVFNSVMSGTDCTNMLCHVQAAAQQSPVRWLNKNEDVLRQRVQDLREVTVPLAAAVGMEVGEHVLHGSVLLQCSPP